jgi:ribosomal protein L37AE/L43A
MTTIPVLANRVMRARRETECPRCSRVIRIGQMIARCPGGLWMHCSCYIANGGHRHNTDDGQCVKGQP